MSKIKPYIQTKSKVVQIWHKALIILSTKILRNILLKFLYFYLKYFILYFILKIKEKKQ